MSSALQGLPQLPSDDPYEVFFVDLASILERTPDGELFSALVPRSRVEGGLGLALFPPRLLERAFDPETFEAEAGFAPTDIEHIAEVTTGVDSATLLTGPSDWGGVAQPYVEGVRTIGAGDDFGIDLESSRVLDAIGRPLRVAELDGSLLATFSTPVAEGWVNGTGARYGDLERLSSMAAELDRLEVVNAALFDRQNFLALPRPQLGESADELEQRLAAEAAETYVSEPFVALGIGSAIRDGQTIDVVTYRFLTDESAEAAMASIEEAWSSTVLLASREPISSVAQFESVERAGSVVTVVAVVPDDRVSGALTMFFNREAPFVFG